MQNTSANGQDGHPSVLISCHDLEQLIAKTQNRDTNPQNHSSRKNHTNSLLIPLVLEVGKAEHFVETHIENARHVDYSAFVRSDGKTGGLLPTLETMQSVLQQLGVSQHSYLICYDRTGNSAAARLIWTLHAFGFYNCSLLDGGIEAWQAAGYPTNSGNADAAATVTDPARLVANRLNVVNSDELLQMINENRSPALLDARSRAEYDGTDVRSARGGHIPGARWLEWTKALDTENHQQLLSDDALLQQITDAGFSSDDTIVAYCQTHQRSSMSYVILKHLGFNHVRGLEGAWSEWGNREDTPIEK